SLTSFSLSVLPLRRYQPMQRASQQTSRSSSRSSSKRETSYPPPSALWLLKSSRLGHFTPGLSSESP
ncbi:hypothetical protein FQN49_003047, partial [Arthroderma sp. PD_2]